MTTLSEADQHFTRQKVKTINRQKYIEQFGLVHGKTIFVIPESNKMGTLPLYFWTMSIQFFQLLGYHVLVNTQNKIYGDDVKYCFPPLDDLIGLCNECGLVYAIRNNISEAIASETTAKVFLFNVQAVSQEDSVRSVLSLYPFIDNSDHHIVEIAIPEKKEDFAWINNAQATFDQFLEPLYLNIKLRDNLYTIADQHQYQHASLCSYSRVPNIILFNDYPELRCENFCSIEYSFYTENNLIYLNMNIKPYYQFIIHIALKLKTTNEIVKTYPNYNYQHAIFQVADDNEYYAVIHIVDPATRQSAIFETYSVFFQCLPKYKLSYYTEYAQYINKLYELCKQNMLIFIVYKDTHTSENTCQYSWVTIMDNGNDVKKNINLDQTDTIEYQWDDNQAYISASDTSISVIINGEEQAVDYRGLNFVVWDKEENKLLDSVCFDTYVDSLEAHRL